MTDVLKMGRKALTVGVAVTTIAWSMAASVLVAPLQASAAGCTSGSLVKGSLAAVYYCGADGKRYVFPNQKTYMTWYADFSGVTTISDSDLAALQIGGNVTYKPGVKMVKIVSDPKVYAVDKGGALRPIANETTAAALYGSNWNKQIDDVPDAFFTNYTVGAAVNSSADFTPATATSAATGINADKGLGSVAATGALSLSLDASNPASATIISNGTNATAGGQSFIDMLKVHLSGKGTVTGLKFHRMGVTSDSDVDTAYLYNGSTKVADLTSLSGGVLTFTNSTGLATLTGTDQVLTLKMDLLKSAASGKTIGWSVSSASDVTLADGSTAGGSYPLTGNLMTVAVVSDMARLQVTGLVNSATVDPGTLQAEIMKFTLQSSNQDVKITKLVLTGLGSIDCTGLVNLGVFQGATQVGSTVASYCPSGAKVVTFDWTASPYVLTNGTTKTFSVRADVVGGSTRTIQLSIQKGSDLMAWDANYNVGVRADSGTIGTFAVTNATQMTVNSGSMTTNLNSASPTGNVALNASNVQIAKYDLKAVGEDIKVSTVTVQVDTAGGTAWSNLRNVRLSFNGSQIGTTQVSVAPATPTAVTVNFTVPAGTTGSLTVNSDIAANSGTAVDGSSKILTTLKAGTNNAQRSLSLGTFNFPSADVAANTLAVASGALTAAKNAAYGNQTLVNSTPGVKLASFLLTAGSPEGESVSNVAFTDRNSGDSGNCASSLGAAFTNLKLKKSDGTQLGQTIVPNTNDAANTTYTFNFATAYDVAAGSTVQLDLYGDILSAPGSGWSGGCGVRMTSATATGDTTSTTPPAITATTGQTITTTTSGTLTLANDSTTPVSTQLVMGQTGKTLAVWQYTANTVEDLTISQMIVTNTNSAGNGNVKNLALYVNGVQVGSTVPALDGNSKAKFQGLSIVVPKATSKTVTLKADIPAFADGALSGTKVTMQANLSNPISGVGTDPTISTGASGQFSQVATTAATGNDQYPYRTTLTASIACNGSCSPERTRAATDSIGLLTLTGTSNADAQFRAALQISDTGASNIALWTATGTGPTADTTAAQEVDGTGLKVVSAAATASGLVADAWSGQTGFGNGGTTTNLQKYSQIQFWLFTTNPTAGQPTYTLCVSDDSACLVNTHQFVLGSSGTSTAITRGGDSFMQVPVSALNNGALTASSRFVTLTVSAPGAGSVTTEIDDLRFYNESINLEVGGTLNSSASSTALFLKDNGGIVRAKGYYTGTASSGNALLTFGDDIGTLATQVPSSGLHTVGATSVVDTLVTNTNTLVAPDTTATESLTITLALGTPSAAGDFRWWDQALGGNPQTTASSVTWFNGVTPISIGLGY